MTTVMDSPELTAKVAAMTNDERIDRMFEIAEAGTRATQSDWSS